MAPKVQLKLISQEIIKPSSSSPNNHPKIHNLSFFDHISPSIYVPLIFFYKSRNYETNHQSSNLLKVSLSNALSHYYPLAGRIKEDVTVDCNDEGVLYLEATIDFSLSEFMGNPDDEIMTLLFPEDSLLTSFVAVQVTYFKCGGMSIGLCLSHKVLDMASMVSFINDWASLSREPDQKIDVAFDMGSLYPPVDLSTLKQSRNTPLETRPYVSRRVVFEGSKIDKLKEMVANRVPNPTRVEVVTALLYKSAIYAAAKASSSGSLKPGFMIHVMNLRAHVSPPLSERNKGNIFGIFSVSTMEDREVELGWLVNEFRKSKTRLSDSCAETSNKEELCSWMLKTLKDMFAYSSVENEVFTCTSWCRFPFYEVDFGWGKPLCVATVFRDVNNNAACLRDTREGNGIEGLISLEEKAMAEFEQDQEVLSFCCIDPSIRIP